MGTNYHFHSWRVFVIICALPCTVSMVALRFMPESPRFLLEVSQHAPTPTLCEDDSPSAPLLSCLHDAHHPVSARQAHHYIWLYCHL